MATPKKCKFCEELEGYKRIHAHQEQRDPYDPELGPYLHDYKVALVIRSWFKKWGKRNAGRTVSFRYKGLGFDLNYCPECGKELRKK